MRRHLLSMTAGTVLVIGLISIILFLVTNEAGQGRISKTRVGLVMGENGAFSGFVTQAMNSLGEIGEAFDFEEMSEEDGTELLERGELTTLIIIPDEYVRSLFYGENKPIIIRYASSRAGLPSMLIKQLTGAAASYIIDTEAGIYSVKDWYAQKGTPLSTDAENELNIDYLKTVFNRNASVSEELIDVDGSVSLTQYYIAVGIAMWLLLAGLCCRGMFKSEEGSLSALVAVRGVSYPAQSMLSGLAFLCTYGLYYLIIAIPVSVFGCFFYDIKWYTALLLLPSVWLAAAVIRFVYTVVSDRMLSIVILLLSVLIMGFISGYFYPSQYLPESLRNIGAWLPTRLIFEAVRDGIAGEFVPVTAALTLLYAVVFDVLSVFIDTCCRVRRWS